jgi:hypothetical protein
MDHFCFPKFTQSLNVFHVLSTNVPFLPTKVKSPADPETGGETTKNENYEKPTRLFSGEAGAGPLNVADNLVHEVHGIIDLFFDFGPGGTGH